MELGKIKWTLVVGALMVLFLNVQSHAQDIIEDNIVISASCYNYDGGTIPVITDGAGDFLCTQYTVSNDAFIYAAMLGVCSDGTTPTASQYAYAVNCKYGPYSLTASVAASSYNIPNYDGECGDGDDLGSYALGFIQADGYVVSPFGEILTHTSTYEDCAGDAEVSVPGAATGTNC